MTVIPKLPWWIFFVLNCVFEIFGQDLSYTGQICHHFDNQSTWQNGCNTCHCTPSGEAVCTEELCSSPDAGIIVGPPDCTGIASWRYPLDPCLWCDCVDSKGSCRPVQCDKPQIDVDKSSDIDCEYTNNLSRWKKACNWCFCTKNGNIDCSSNICLPGYQRLPECEGSASWRKDDCTWCHCKNGNAECQQTECESTSDHLQPVPSEPIECTMGDMDPSEWKDECNWCQCIEPGFAGCTRKLCTDPKDIGGTICKGNPTWKDNAGNWCECDQGKAVCNGSSTQPNNEVTPGEEITRKEEEIDEEIKRERESTEVMEIEVTTQESETETPEEDFEEDLIGKSCRYKDEKSRWRRSCNWCHCTDDEEPICAINKCKPDYDNLLGKDAPDCEGTASWRKDKCTWCDCVDRKANCRNVTCAAQGVSTKTGPDCIPFPKSSWKNECNWCECIMGSNVAVCSRKLCTDPRANDSLCKGKPIWKNEQGYWCHCKKGKAVCKNELPQNTVGAIFKLPTEVCSDGTTWIDDCNSCHCVKGQAFCTDLNCKRVNGQYSLDVLLDFHNSIQNVAFFALNSFDYRKCKEGSRWTRESPQGCLNCFCSDETKSMCSKGSCSAIYLHQAPLCKAGSEWIDDCNVCICPQGVPICTKMDCKAHDLVRVAMEDSTAVPPPPPEVKCTLGSTWMQDCNSCSCIFGNDMCTQLACTANEAGVKKCKDGSQWRDAQCQWCTCSNQSAVCTKQRCAGTVQESPSIYGPILDTKNGACTRGSRWKQGCKWCNCVGGMALCNLVICSAAEDKKEDKKCEGNSQWRLGTCTWCKCHNGTGICETEKRCARDTAVTNGIAGCRHGNKWISGCDYCVCVHGIASCVKRSCNRIGTPCSRKGEWTSGCKICQCIDSVTHCTQRPNCKEKKLPAPRFCYSQVVKKPAKNKKTSCSTFNQIRWTYRWKSGKCNRVYYEGCKKYKNLFKSVKECLNTCLPKLENDFRREKKTRELGNINCRLNIERGACFASYKRYGFDTQKGLCVPFEYSGCLGNENNFLTAKHCYEECGGFPPIANPTCDRASCPWQRFGHYLWKNCRPVYEGGACCPTSFECKNYLESLDSNKCYYKKKAYSIGEFIPIDDVCLNSCKCISSFTPGHRAEISCAEVECLALFDPPNPSCRNIYQVGECCPVGTECGGPTKPTMSTREANCKWEGRTWRIGDKMHFRNSPCVMCICTPNFTYPGGHGCKTVECGFDYRYRGKFAKNCTPIYFENQCCPHADWLCPNQDLIEVLPPTRKISDMNCYFGQIAIPLGANVRAKKNCKIECQCQTPPELSCLKRRVCSNTHGRIAGDPGTANNLSPQTCPPNCHPDVSPNAPRSLYCRCDKTPYKCPAPVCPKGSAQEYITFSFKQGCHICVSSFKK